MNREPDEIRKEIEETRDSLAKKVDRLGGQVKEGIETARDTGLKIAGVAFAAVLGILTLKRLRRRK